MAYTYGSVTNCKVRNGQTRTEYECRLGYQVNSQSIENNTSNVTLRLECRSVSSSYVTKGSSGLTSVIDGSTVKSNASVDMSNTNTWQNFGERTITITHNADGTCSVSKSGSFTCTAGSSNYSLSSGSASVTVAPATIPRYANFIHHHIASVGTNSVNVYWGADATCDAIQCSVNGGGWFDVSGYPEYTIGGLSPNTSYSIRTKIRRQDSQLWTESGTIYATTDQVTPNITGIWVKSVGLNSITFAVSCDWAHTFYYKLVNWNDWIRGWNNINYAEVTITGLAPNTTYTLEVLCRNWINEGANIYKDAYVTCVGTTLDIGIIKSAPDINFGDSARITKSNPSGVLNNLRIETLNPTVTIASRNNVGDDYTLILTDTEWDELYRKLGDNNAITIRYVIDTYGDAIHYHWVDRTLTLTGNQKTSHTGISGARKRAKVFIGVNGSVKRAVMWIGNNGRKRCI